MAPEKTTTRDTIVLAFLASYITLLGLMPIVGLFVLDRGQSIVDRPEIFASALLVAITSSALLIYTRSDVLEVVIYNAETSETIWGELISYTVLLIVAFIATSFVLVPIQTRLGYPELTSVIQLAVCSSLGLAAVYLHRNDRIQLPTWMTATRWGFWDHFALFAAVTALTIIYANTVFDPTSGLLAGIALLFGIVAVLLRRRTSPANQLASSAAS